MHHRMVSVDIVNIHLIATIPKQLDVSINLHHEALFADVYNESERFST